MPVLGLSPDTAYRAEWWTFERASVGAVAGGEELPTFAEVGRAMCRVVVDSQDAIQRATGREVEEALTLLSDSAAISVAVGDVAVGADGRRWSVRQVNRYRFTQQVAVVRFRTGSAGGV